MRIEASTIEELFVAAGPREDELREIDRIITEAAPTLSRSLFATPSITMVGYGEIDWDPATESGHWPVIGLTAQKHHLAIYVAASKDGTPLAELYQSRLGKTNNGKGCIRFRRVGDIDVDELSNAVRDAVAWADDTRAAH